MIRLMEIRTTESIQAQLLKIFLRIGYVRSAEWAKMSLFRKINKYCSKTGPHWLLSLCADRFFIWIYGNTIYQISVEIKIS